MKASLRKMGNSQGIVIPKALIAQMGIEGGVEMTIEDDAIVLRKADRAVREGWADASARLAAADDDALVWPEFGNAEDEELAW